MHGESEVFHEQYQGFLTVERCRPNFEYSFMLPGRSRAGRILDICCGLVRPIMMRRSPPLLRITLVGAAVMVIACLLRAPAAPAQPLADEPRAEPVRREILAVYDSRE